MVPQKGRAFLFIVYPQISPRKCEYLLLMDSLCVIQKFLDMPVIANNLAMVAGWLCEAMVAFNANLSVHTECEIRMRKRKCLKEVVSSLLLVKWIENWIIKSPWTFFEPSNNNDPLWVEISGSMLCSRRTQMMRMSAASAQPWVMPLKEEG